MEKKSLIFDIQGFSVHDGPGDRTLIFLSGCPLRCEWCANPEGKKLKQNLLFTSGRCKAVQNQCKSCVAACPRGAVTMDPESGLPKIQRAHCVDCKEYPCTNACNYEALRVSGTYYTLQELMDVLKRDKDFWGTDGGVTFSGGDPFVQWEFLLDALKECKKNNMHTAIETSAYTDENIFLKVLEYIDFAFVDIKNMDSQAHKAKTGVGNEVTLRNLRALKKSGWNGRLVLRTPIIPGFNDSVENAEKTADFMNENGFFEINLLPFHRLGTSKWEQLGTVYKYKHQEALSKKDLEYLQDVYFDKGIACYLDTDIVYNLSAIQK